MRKNLFITFVLVAVSWQTVSAQKTLTVAAEESDCYGPFLRQCLQVKDDEYPGAGWRLFYDYIDGFDYQPGYEYVLKVSATRVENPPQDGSAVKYTLLEEVSKSKV